MRSFAQVTNESLKFDTNVSEPYPWLGWCAAIGTLHVGFESPQFFQQQFRFLHSFGCFELTKISLTRLQPIATLQKEI
jgi:hypothetical protein